MAHMRWSQTRKERVRDRPAERAWRGQRAGKRNRTPSQMVAFSDALTAPCRPASPAAGRARLCVLRELRGEIRSHDRRVTASQLRAAIARVVLAMFHDVILRAAFERRLGAIERRLVCTAPEDYATSIEPSDRGGAGIAHASGVYS